MKNEEKDEKFNFLNDEEDMDINTKDEEEKEEQKNTDDEEKEQVVEEHEEDKNSNDDEENNHNKHHHGNNHRKNEKEEKDDSEDVTGEEDFEYEASISIGDETDSTEFEDNKSSKKESNNSNEASSLGSGFYLSYEMRVMSMVLLSILFLGISSFFVIQAVTYSESKSVNYSESSNVDYKVCLEENDDYAESCLGQDMQYLSLITKNVPVTFNYTAKLSSPIDYSLDYYVVGSLKIVDRDNNERVLYTSEDVLVPNTKVSNQNDTIQFTSNIDVDFKEYNNYVTSYKSRYSLNSDAYLDVILYLNESTGPRRVSSLTIPLGIQTYGISKSQTLVDNKNIVKEDKKWTTRNYVSAGIGTLCALVGLVILIKLITLVLKVSNSKSKYQRKLSQILREYDRVIVVARNGYEVNPDKKLIKVLSFNELLDARDALEKPVVYVKVNEVKSEFYVEDIDKIYQYVMKEADF